MSHLATIVRNMKNLSVVERVAQKRHWGFDAAMKERQHFSGTATGASVQLPGWKYPVIIDAEGSLHYDHYNGAWGDPKHLQTLLQDYAVEETLQDLQMAGMSAYLGAESVEQGRMVAHIVLS